MKLSPNHPTTAGLPLTTQQLEYLVAVSRATTSAEAAASLGVTPSALSQGLAEFERRLGIPLFERQGRRRVLSPYGLEAVERATRILAMTADMARWAEASKAGQTGRVHVGMIDVAAVHHFASALTRFRVARPNVDFMLTVGPSAMLLDRLRSSALDAAVVVNPPISIDGIITNELLTEQLGIYPPPGINAGSPSTWGPWVAFPSSSHTRRLIAAELGAIGAEYRVTAESHQPEVLRQLVALGIGWAALPVVQGEVEPAPLRRAANTPMFDRTLVLARRRRSTDSPALTALFELMSMADPAAD